MAQLKVDEFTRTGTAQNCAVWCWFMGTEEERKTTGTRQVEGGKMNPYLGVVDMKAPILLLLPVFKVSKVSRL